MADEVVTTDTAASVASTTETSVETLSAAPTEAAAASTTETTVETVEPQQPAPPTEVKKPWYERRIDKLTAEKHDADRALKAAEAALAALSGKPTSEATSTTTQAEVVPASEVERLANVRAAELASKATFDAKCNSIYNNGVAKFKDDFKTATTALNQNIGMTPAFIEAADATGMPADIINALGKDLDEAARIMALPPIQMAVELTKLTSRLTAPTRVSRAPEPIQPITSRAPANPDELRDDLPIEEWMRRRTAQTNAKYTRH